MNEHSKEKSKYILTGLKRLNERNSGNNMQHRTMLRTFLEEGTKVPHYLGHLVMLALDVPYKYKRFRSDPTLQLFGNYPPSLDYALGMSGALTSERD